MHNEKLKCECKGFSPIKESSIHEFDLLGEAWDLIDEAGGKTNKYRKILLQIEKVRKAL